jgi:cob(I)alamin adenosyltransferase
MATRLSKIATRTGDQGSTGLGDGSRVDKNHPRIQTIGDIDELNSKLGLLLCEALPPAISAALTVVQHDLFDLGGELSIPGHTMIGDDHVARLDVLLERHNADLAPLKEFVLPGGSRSAAQAHVCRTVCRRAERSLVQLGKQENLNPESLRYLNRLSDLLFVLARCFNALSGQGDVLWNRERD